MIKNCTYYWEKVAILHFANLSMDKKMELAEKWLGKDELIHPKELLGRDDYEP